MFNILENSVDGFEKVFRKYLSNEDAWLIDNNIPIKNIPYKLNDVDILKIINPSLESVVNIPNNMNILKFYMANSLIDLDLSKCNVHEYFEILTCRGLKTVVLPKVSENINIHIEQCYKLTKIETKQHITKLKIKKCSAINSLSCVDIPFVSALNIEYTNISDFSKQNIHTNKFLLRCENIKSFRGVEDVDVHESLTLSRVMKFDNLICAMLTKALVLKIHIPGDNYINRDLYNCFVKYEKDKNRSESIMDVVTWLLDNGYEEAAEV